MPFSKQLFTEGTPPRTWSKTDPSLPLFKFVEKKGGYLSKFFVITLDVFGGKYGIRLISIHKPPPLLMKKYVFWRTNVHPIESTWRKMNDRVSQMTPWFG